eukprot:CAMPEP_0170238434 /NCGR_PEP_ID=MMETSP0116_2-20130129/18972_1 /TAXON_ID=400756 /ORGANISM="Durinskia baltica, Strain CSIRO CS-38" /LENGTH=132 /DNA_ID=CAMNT_0010489247 /DNA_START=18 /DNA_END=416 /DNA_ORIENTATION=+
MRGEAVSEVGRIGGALPKCGASAWKSDCPQPGECKPCSWYFSSPAPCPRGATCPFCHVHNQKRSVRPCKSKRRSLEKAIAKIDQLFLADPANITSHTAPVGLQERPVLARGVPRLHGEHPRAAHFDGLQFLG